VSGVNVKLNEEVQSIQHLEDCTSIKCASGLLVHARQAVVLTVPLGVLKSETISFDPPLNAEKMEAINRIGVGSYHKLALRFDKAFWDTNLDILFFCAEGRDESSAPFPWFLNYDKMQPGACTLEAHSTGAAADLLEEMGEAAAVDMALGVLRKAFGKDIVPEPVEVSFTTWNADKYSRGAYSFMSVGSSPSDQQALAEPFHRLRFAGEATCRGGCFATVHGAVETGFREANAILMQVASDVKLTAWNWSPSSWDVPSSQASSWFRHVRLTFA